MPATKLLLATDLSCRCDRALDRALALAAEWRAELVVVHAIERPVPVSDAPSRPQADPQSRALRRIRADLGVPAGVAVELVVERAEPAALVLDTAARADAALIITGAGHDDGDGRVALGSTMVALARRATVPVLAVKTRPHGPYRDVVVASDFSESSRRALVTAFALLPAASLSLVHAFQVVYEGFIEDKVAAREGTARRALDEAGEFLSNTPIPAGRRVETRAEYGRPEVVLRDLALTGGVDLVVAGTRGRGRIARFLLGSVATALLAELPTDVLIVPRAE